MSIHNDPKIGLFRRIWRWWQIPIFASFEVIEDRIFKFEKYPDTLLTITGTVLPCIVFVWLLYHYVLEKLFNKIMPSAPPEILNHIMRNYGFDNIPLRLVDKYRLWVYRSKALKFRGFFPLAISAMERADEIKKELIIIKLSRI